ncbi:MULTISPECIES: hypothetical protein [unclassified Amycolatopsis]|uniref:hypothetical protein n=1 Tax=unclassified Amycolatopsis TaxID=2618356 RepID=UPI0027DB8FA8|nr:MULTISPECIES: hypothetical protein [unclassified Amycolatopsis]HET6708948.1 hypothetical protein [Amycolatopsis sp.]
MNGNEGVSEVGVTDVVGWTVTSTKLVVVVGGDVSTDVTVDGGTDEVTVTGTAATVLVGGVTVSTVRGVLRPAMSSAATSSPEANPASPVTAAEPQVGRPFIRAPPPHARRGFED